MTVLRIEKNEVTAKTIETVIIGIPVDQWELMRSKQFLLSLIPFLVLLGSVGGAIVNSDNVPVMFSLIVCSFFVARLLIVAGGKISEIEDSLLKKHGWDSEARYRVELEQPQHFPLD